MQSHDNANELVHPQINEVYFNIPKSFNIPDAFRDMPNKVIPKVECILWLINRDTPTGGYQCNAENHTSFFGLKDAEFSAIMNRLVKHNIIKVTSNYQSGEVSRFYKMVTPYTRDESIVKTYYPN